MSDPPAEAACAPYDAPISAEDQHWIAYMMERVPEGRAMFAERPSVPLQYLRG